MTIEHMSARQMYMFCWVPVHLFLAALTMGLSLFITIPIHIWQVTFGHKEIRRDLEAARLPRVPYLGYRPAPRQEEGEWKWVKK